MTGNMAATNGPRVLGPEEGELTLAPDGFTGDRFMIDGKDSGGGFALVEHRLAPHVLAAPLLAPFSDGIQMMNSAIAANWHVAAAQT